MAAKSLVPLLYRLSRNPKNPLSLSTRTLSSFTSATPIDLHAYMIKNLSPENLKTEPMVCMLDMCCALRNEGFALQASDIFPVAHERYNVPRIVHETLLIRFLLDNGMPRQAIVLYEISIPINFPSAILEILKQAVENINLSPKEERSSVPSANVIAYSLIMLRDICANQNESMNDVIISLLSSGLIELLVSLLKDLEPPDMVKEAMKQSKDIAETSSKALEPALYKGFHRDIVSVIANCAFKRKCVQDEVRERNGIHLLLQRCVTDEDNPFLKEWGVFAMRNFLEGNMENQQCVAELKLQGCVEFPEISNLGMKVEIDPISRRPRLVNIP